jgi:DNA-binding CsgD family transcriptional regulator
VVDVWYHELLRRHSVLPTGFIYFSDELVDTRELLRTRFHADYLIPCDIGCNLGLIVGSAADSGLAQTAVSFYRPIGGTPFSNADAQVLASLQPHLTQALRMRLSMDQQASRLGSLALEACNSPVMLVARSRSIQYANPAAEAILSRRKLTGTSRRLQSESAQVNTAMEKAIDSCSTFRLDAALPHVFRLTGPPGSGVLARIAPIPGSAALPPRAALIFLSEEGAVPADLPTIAAKAYGLTPAETALIRGLLGGFSPEEVAEQRHVALPTIKAQLRSVFSKTGVRRQAGLMRLLLSIGH